MDKMPQRAARGLIAFLMLFLLPCFAGSAYARQNDEPRPKAWLGVTVRDVTQETSKANRLQDETGAYVTDVAADSPADSAGIREDDIIIGFGDKEIDDANDLVRAVSKAGVGDDVRVQLVRKGEKQVLQVVLGKFPHRTPMAMNKIFRKLRVFGHGTNEGLQLMELNDQLAEYFGVPEGNGLLVVKVKKGSAAEKSGIKAGDVLLKIGKRTIDDMEDVPRALAKYDNGEKVDVEVFRKGANKTLSLEINRDDDDYSNDFFGNGCGHDDVFRLPPFQEFRYEIPHFDENDFQFDVHPDVPDMKGLEHRLQNLQKSLKEKQHNLMIRVRTVKSV